MPSDLPSIIDGAGEDGEEKEAMWEERATRLARGNPNTVGLREVEGKRGEAANAAGDVRILGCRNGVGVTRLMRWCSRISRKRSGCMRLEVSEQFFVNAASWHASNT